MDYFTIAINLVNSLLPFAFSWVLYKNYTRKRLRFYLLWLIGFIAYGISNSLNSYNIFFEISSPSNVHAVALFVLITFSCIITGIGELVHRAKESFVLSLGAPLILSLLFLFGAPIDTINLFFLLPYVIISGAFLVLQLKYRANLGTPLVGFAIILLANLGYATGHMSVSVSPIFSIIGKCILFYWMTLPHFSAITEDFESFMTSTVTQPIDESSGWIYMVEVSSINGLNDWIKKRVDSRPTIDTRSILMLLDDQITQGSLSHSGLADDNALYIIRCAYGPHKIGQIFSGHLMEISNNIDELSILISDILDFIEVNNTNTQMFFFDLSTLILQNGWRRVYTFLIALIPQLKSKRVQTFFIYTPGVQKHPHETQILRHLGDRIIELGEKG